jgi:hypothetical protein
MPRLAERRTLGGILVLAAVVVAASAIGTAIAGSASARVVRTRTAVIGAASFVPIVSDCQYGRGGISGGDDAGLLRDDNTCAYAAPVSLPQGARVTKMKFVYDSHVVGTKGVLELTRHFSSGGRNDMASVTATQGCAAPCSSVTTNVVNAHVDNSRYTYTLRVYNGGTATSGFFTVKAVITYTIGS